MTRIGFYHLLRWPLEQALPKLLERVLGADMKAVVLARSGERVEALNRLLWEYAPDSWLPHGSAEDGDAAEQPVWLTVLDENPNGAEVLVLVDGASSEQLGTFGRCLDVFDGNDPEAVAAARKRWAAAKDQGHELVYYQQTEQGGWVEKAKA